ncbi:MAG: ornithine cyclodeaminase family protein [Thermodesulfobacteriota bacterium]
MAIFLSSREVMSLLSMKELIEIVEDAYGQMGRGESTMLPRFSLDTLETRRFLRVVPASLSSMGVAGIKASAPSGKGSFVKVILIFDTHTGDLRAVIESDWIGWLVPGALSAVATKYLSRKDSRVLAIFGSGRQARSQLMAISYVRNLELVKVYSPQKLHREQYCEEMGKLYPIQIVPVDSPEEMLKGSDIIATTTNSRKPVFDGNLVEPGTHMNKVGAHYPERREVDTVCLQRSKVIADSKVRALKEDGEFVIPVGEGAITADHLYGELGEIIAGKKPGRKDEREITLFLSGDAAIEFIAVGAIAYQRAQEKGIGQSLRVEKEPAIPKSLYMKRY